MTTKLDENSTEKPGAGRPRKPIDWQLFEDLCSIQCTQGEIASMLRLDVSTLHDRAEEHYNSKYPEIYKKYSEIGKISLRRLQFKHAQKSFGMAIWLGKQWLGQKDHDPMITAPPELMQQFNAIMVQIGRRQSEVQGLSQSNALKDCSTDLEIPDNNSLHSSN